jgi:hypothetical protein
MLHYKICRVFTVEFIARFKALEANMSEPEKSHTEEEKRNNRFSFIVGIFIGLAIIILFVLLFH